MTITTLSAYQFCETMSYIENSQTSSQLYVYCATAFSHFSNLITEDSYTITSELFCEFALCNRWTSLLSAYNDNFPGKSRIEILKVRKIVDKYVLAARDNMATFEGIEILFNELGKNQQEQEDVYAFVNQTLKSVISHGVENTKNLFDGAQNIV